MSDVAIRVEGLGKQYHIGGKVERYKTLRDTLTDAFVAPFRRASKLLGGQATGAAELDETIWALRDVSFEVKRGEVIGIIGGNGAGKSTLLKVLSRITEPTAGVAEIHGRIGSLLEVGTGFHPELTGRENIYLNGAILGMRQAEIEQKFDEMVAFAEVEKFIDTPVKHYSSGMYVRLAFAVAAHLEPEVLLIDEVLAVGDVAFQKKCLGKIGDVAKAGKTVLFVSHTMSAITSLCQRGILLEMGSILVDDIASKAVSEYLSSMHELVKLDNGYISLLDHPGRRKKFDSLVRFTSCILSNGDDQRVEYLGVGQTIKITLGYKITSPIEQANIIFAIVIANSKGERVSYLSSEVVGVKLGNLPTEGNIQCIIPRLPLVPGRYSLTFLCKVGNGWSDAIYDAVYIDVMSGYFYSTGRLPPVKVAGNLLIDYEWGLI